MLTIIGFKGSREALVLPRPGFDREGFKAGFEG